MARHIKKRIICKEPSVKVFKAGNSSKVITLTYDEYEVLRLIDVVKMDQKLASLQMGVARTTVQAIYDEARSKVATFIFDGGTLKIEGGEYLLCDGDNQNCPYASYCLKKRRMLKMKVAVTYENGMVFQHFGHTEQIEVFEIEGKKILSSKVISTEGHDHCALVNFLQGLGVDVLICGGIGNGAKQKFVQSGIKLFNGVEGTSKDAVEKFINDELIADQEATCHHDEDHEHHHGEGHECHHDGSGHHHECHHHHE